MRELPEIIAAFELLCAAGRRGARATGGRVGGGGTGRAVMARYDTTDDEALAAGVATGCRGVVEVFIERVDARAGGPLLWIRRAIGERGSCAIATVVRGAGVDVGARLVVQDDGAI